MSSIIEMVHKYTVKKSNKFKKICEPLYTHFGINHFWYSKTTEDGKHFSVASNPEMHDYYHASKFHLHSPFFRNPILIPSGIYNYQNVKDPKFQDTISASAIKVDVFLGVGIVSQSHTEMIRFGYASNRVCGKDINDIILNNFSLLLKFNEYFLQESQELLKNIEEDFVDLPTEMGDIYNKKPSGLLPISQWREKCVFLEKIGMIKLSDIEKLTVRELECLKYLYQGLNSRQTGHILVISNRTVEKHIDSIKTKLNCYSKLELSKISHSLHCAGFFN